jgi:hypothetical protein
MVDYSAALVVACWVAMKAPLLVERKDTCLVDETVVYLELWKVWKKDLYWEN